MQRLSLSIIAVSEKIKQQPDLFKRILLDGAHNTRSIDEMSVFLQSMCSFSENTSLKDLEHFLNVSYLLSSSTVSFHDFLMTVRHLNAMKTFAYWNDFYICAGLIHSSQIDSEIFLTTVRHLITIPKFLSWSSFFTAVKVLAEKNDNSADLFFTAVRHATEYFLSDDSLKSIFRTLSISPQYSEAFSYGQLDSKKWLIEEATKIWGQDWGRVFVLAGWIGVLPRFLFEYKIKCQAVRSFDRDDNVGPVAELINQNEVQKDWLFKSSTLDIASMTYPTEFLVRRKDNTLCTLMETPDIVINTSCEHISDIDSWWNQIPKGTRVVLQSNDGFDILGHERCFKTLEDFVSAMKLSKIEFQGQKALPEFNRFMLMGLK